MQNGTVVEVLRPDTHPDPPVERGPEEKGVGVWVPKEKHMYLATYLHATRHAWNRFPHRVLIDPFCGPGRIQVKGEDTTRDGGAMVAWRQSVHSGMPFTQVLVGDLDPDRAAACAARLAAAGAPVESFAGPAVETVKAMAARVQRRGALCMAYIDPYNLQYLSFEIIESLAKLKVDFAVHFSTMDLARNVDAEFTRARFDEAAPGWRDHINVRAMGKAAARDAFFKYWCSKVRDLGFQFSEAMPLITNDQQHGIYRLVFFARSTSDLPTRIWNDIARGPNRELF
jgi:three-Cys-motif partner protein